MNTNHIPLFEAVDLAFAFQGKSILKDINLKIHRGEVLTIIGPNGAGKTTLVKLISGLLVPTSGQCVRQAGLSIGYVPQKFHPGTILPMTVRRFLALPPNKSVQLPLCQEVGIDAFLDQSLATLSGGQWQRVMLARALMSEPDLLVLDEPIQGIDLSGQSEFYRLLSQIKMQRDCGIVMVSHDLNFVMAGTEKVVCLNHHICCSGHPESVSKDPEFVALFGHMADRFAKYSHDHDHQHDVTGVIIQKDKSDD